MTPAREFSFAVSCSENKNESFMKMYQFYEEQHLPVTIDEAWSFFSNPENLSLITPPSMNFSLANVPEEEIYPGMIITYKVSPLFNIPLTWVTEITAADKPNFFIDEQRFGPYKFWHHRHSFKEAGGGVLMKDEVHYSLPFEIIGRLGHFLLVKKRVEGIFKYRKEALTKMFSNGKNTFSV